MSTEDRIVVGITHGDINGIGYEVILKALNDTRIFDFCTPVIYGSPKVAAYHRKALNLPNLNLNTIKNIGELNHKRINIINCIDDNVRVELGKSTPMAGESSVLALQAAIADLKENKFDVLVTAPINKHNVQTESFAFTGHTEYLSSTFDCTDSLMLMVSENLRVGLVTSHVSITKVSELITVESILKKLRIMNQSLRVDFGIEKPLIAVLGLNPHAGDNGLLGEEEQKVIIPALQQAREEKIMALGPYPADGFFGTLGFTKFHAVLAMYHDQGLIPFKTMNFDRGVNFTAGLPIVRTSPAHGTAFDLAGKNSASPESFLSALYLALDVHRNRKAIEGIVPLEKHVVFEAEQV